MKENYNILNLPQDLAQDLISVRRIETDSQDWFDLASIREIQWRSIKIHNLTHKYLDLNIKSVRITTNSL
ncbi:hypothetical protein LEP1GSC072_2082 [Leptospira noguchii str. Bonito]|nr:hypothetical protein LEP1GSC072_2082 [Leptospira noguchii str. Bonito]